jgi:hypothetical protein
MKKSISGTSSPHMMNLKASENENERCFRENVGFDFLHYREKLSMPDKKAYDVLKNGFLSCAKNIDMPLSESRGIERIYKYVALDLPLVFHVDGCNVMTTGKAMTVLPKYQMSAAAYERRKKECISEIAGIVRKAKGNDEWGTLLKIHSYIVCSLSYREGSVDEHNITGPLLNGMGVCDGFAKTVKGICDYVGLPCVVIDGDARQSNGITGSHAWNAVKVEGKRQYFDFTFNTTLNRNNPCKSIKCVDYFGLDCGQMSKDHFSWSTSLPERDRTEDYFSKNGLIASKQGELENIILSGLKNGMKEFSFKVTDIWRGFSIEKALKTIVDKAVKANNKGYQYSYTFNDAQGTGYVYIR